MVKTVNNSTNKNNANLLSHQIIVNKKRQHHWYVDGNECPGLGQSRNLAGLNQLIPTFFFIIIWSPTSIQI